MTMVQGPADPGRDGVADYVARLSAALADAGVEVGCVPVEGGPRSVLRAAGLVRRARPDVVHVQFAPSAFGFRPWPGLLPDLVRAPVVTTAHEYGWWAAPAWVPDRVWRVVERPGLLDRETWRLLPASAAAVTTNPGHAAAVRGRLGREPVQIPLAPNVTDHGASAPHAETRRRLGVPADARLVTFFGFVHPVKGVRYLIEALARLRPRHPRLHLLVLGGFASRALPRAEALAFRAELVALAQSCGVARSVTIAGHRPAAEVSAALRASDVAAFPFTAGATTKSGAVLSAFAHGLPTVVTAADPPDPELVDGRTAVVVPRVRDTDALAGALSRVLDDPALSTRVARGGAAVGARRSWSRVAAEHRRVYEGLLR